MLQKTSYRFFWELKHHLSRFLKYHASFVRLRKDLSTNFLRWKRSSFYSQKSIISMFSSSEKFIIWTFSFVQSSCFCNNFFLIFVETYSMFLLIILKDFLNLHYKKKCDAELRNFFLSEFPMSILVASEIPWNRIWHFSFAETEAKMSVF